MTDPHCMQWHCTGLAVVQRISVVPAPVPLAALYLIECMHRSGHTRSMIEAAMHVHISTASRPLPVAALHALIDLYDTVLVEYEHWQKLRLISIDLMFTICASCHAQCQWQWAYNEPLMILIKLIIDATCMHASAFSTSTCCPDLPA
jgi:hypothetical protein